MQLKMKKGGAQAELLQMRQRSTRFKMPEPTNLAPGDAILREMLFEIIRHLGQYMQRCHGHVKVCCVPAQPRAPVEARWRWGLSLGGEKFCCGEVMDQTDGQQRDRSGWSV
jgi:hypothetical protein